MKALYLLWHQERQVGQQGVRINTIHLKLLRYGPTPWSMPSLGRHILQLHYWSSRSSFRPSAVWAYPGCKQRHVKSPKNITFPAIRYIEAMSPAAGLRHQPCSLTHRPMIPTAGTYLRNFTVQCVQETKSLPKLVHWSQPQEPHSEQVVVVWYRKVV